MLCVAELSLHRECSVTAWYAAQTLGTQMVLRYQEASCDFTI